MTANSAVSSGGPPARLGRRRRQSFSRLTVADALAAFSVVTALCGLGGLFDDVSEALALLSIAAITGGIGFTGRRMLQPRRRTPPGRVVSGLASAWIAMVVAGMAVYLLTGITSQVDDALFESAAGFSTTALSTLDVDEFSTTMHIWRASTQWIGGAFGVLAAVIALPSAMRGSVQIPRGHGRRLDRLAPTPAVGRRRVVGIYSGLTALCGLGYLVTGLGTRDSVVHALTTVSTGGFSSRTDSLASAGTGSQLVATVFMLVAGMSYFALWWALRRHSRRFLESSELRLYLSIVVLATVALLVSVDGIPVGDALFSVASAVSTTGYAVSDWTVYPPAALSILLVVVATGSMGASAGGGLRVARVRSLVDFANRELRRQLDPNSVTVVMADERAIDDRELERLTGYQIAHFGLAAVGAFFLALVGVDLITALWTAISVLSTAGPAPGTGAFGDATALGADGRLLLIPGMLAGRVTILPLLLALVSVLRTKDRAMRRVKRMLRSRR